MKQRKQLQIKAKSEISSDKNSADFTVPASATTVGNQGPDSLRRGFFSVRDATLPLDVTDATPDPSPTRELLFIITVR